MYTLTSVVDLFADSNWFTNVNSIIMVVVFIAQNVASTWITNKLNIKNIEVGEVDVKVTDTQDTVKVLTGVTFEMSKAVQKIGAMSATAFMNSNLDPKVKIEVTKNWVEIEKIFQGISVMLAGRIDELTEDAIEKVKSKNALLGQALDIAKDQGGDALTKIFNSAPSYLEELISKNRT